ncbi:hypothetical protein [Maribacter antarcticus]|uniref:hypothetical protein n=1 Tax=Maribacter antarcticus TaxID=505250 RepID=UPI000A9C93D8|nr:hypothetical protein [Maribacter antarcticus]
MYSIQLIDDSQTQQLDEFMIENYQYKNFKNELLEPNKSAFDSDGQKILSSAIFENYVYIRSLNTGFLVKRATVLYEIQNEIL